MGVRIVPAEEGMAEAVERLRAGRLVAFPTETVYGLGANALDADAVAGIFAAKGRPSTNPLIVHVPDTPGAQRLASDEFSDIALTLARNFWPGPLTLVVEKSDGVPDIVTAGGPTVGLRVPDHPVALRLLRESGVPVAAPSANRSEEVSPTTAQHVADSLGPWVDDLLILDGGPCRVGIESTVVDVTLRRPRILRSGMISEVQIAHLIGGEINGQPLSTNPTEPARSPGQMTRHYAPRAQMIVLSNEAIGDAVQDGDAVLLQSENLPEAFQQSDNGMIRLSGGKGTVRFVGLPSAAELYSAQLYALLRKMDDEGAKRILIEEPPHTPEWEAIHDRLRRAAAPRRERFL